MCEGRVGRNALALGNGQKADNRQYCYNYGVTMTSILPAFIIHSVHFAQSVSKFNVTFFKVG